MNLTRDLIIFTVLCGLAKSAWGASSVSVYPTSRACTSGESWSLDAPIGEEFRSEFRSFLSDQAETRMWHKGSVEIGSR